MIFQTKRRSRHLPGQARPRRPQRGRLQKKFSEARSALGPNLMFRNFQSFASRQRRIGIPWPTLGQACLFACHDRARMPDLLKVAAKPPDLT